MCVCKGITAPGTTGMSSNQKLRHLQSLFLNTAVTYQSKVLLARLHLCTEPVRQIEDNISFQILPQSSNDHGYEDLETILMSMSLYEFLVLETVCPPDPKNILKVSS